MGYYLKIGEREIDSKSLVYLTGDIIRSILPSVKEKEDGWKLKKSHVAVLAYFTRSLLEDDTCLRLYTDNDFDIFYRVEDFDEVKENIEWIHNCFVNTLIDMALHKDKHVKVRWV